MGDNTEIDTACEMVEPTTTSGTEAGRCVSISAHMHNRGKACA
jgi:hypothetical protein